MLFNTTQLNTLLAQSYDCCCGRTHQTDLKTVVLKSGALSELSFLLKQSGYHHVLFVTDSQTSTFINSSLKAELKEADISYRLKVFDTRELHADEVTVGAVLISMDAHTDLLISVGSGTLNDTCRFVSYRCGLPYYCIATAPSMDGYASNVAAMTTAHLKTTYPAHNPKIIFADTDILGKAPSEMISAGMGDIIGKFTSLCDWRIAAYVTDEYYCKDIAELTAEARDLAVLNIDRLSSKDPSAIYHLTQALILSGIAMNYTGNSRPASGSEHHISHYWEMNYQQESKKAVLHGTKVGIATVLVLKLYEYLRNIKIDFNKIRNRSLPLMDEAWKNEIRRCFGSAAEGVIELERVTQKNSHREWQKRIDSLELHWNEICKLIGELPSSAIIEDYLKRAGCPIRPREIGLDKQTVIDSIRFAKELRSCYTLLQLLWDLNLLEGFAIAITDDLFGGF